MCRLHNTRALLLWDSVGAPRPRLTADRGPGHRTSATLTCVPSTGGGAPPSTELEEKKLATRQTPRRTQPPHCDMQTQALFPRGRPPGSKWGWGGVARDGGGIIAKTMRVPRLGRGRRRSPDPQRKASYAASWGYLVSTAGFSQKHEGQRLERSLGEGTPTSGPHPRQPCIHN